MADLAGKLPKNEIPVRIVLAESIPLAHSGKPDKQTIQNFLQKAKKFPVKARILVFTGVFFTFPGQ